MKVKDICKQFNVEVELTPELENLNLNDNYQEHHTEKFNNTTVHLFTKEVFNNGRHGTHQILIDPDRQEILTHLVMDDNSRTSITRFNKKGEITLL